MGLSEYPRLPARYSVNHAGIQSGSSKTSSVTTSKEIASVANNSIELDQELLLRAACAWVLSSHAGEITFAFHQKGKGLVEGNVDGTVEDLLQHCRSARKVKHEKFLPFLVTFDVGMQESARDNANEVCSACHLVVAVAENGLQLSLTHDVEVLGSLEAEWFLTHLAKAVHLVSSTPANMMLSSLTLIEEEEQKAIEGLGCSPPPPDLYPSTIVTLPGIFLNTVAQTPEAPALQFDNIILSYKQIYALSAHFATHLLSVGIKKGTVIPLCVEKSIEMIVSMLAIELIGCAYLNLEPAWPLGRKEGIIGELEVEGWLGAEAFAIVQNQDEATRWQKWKRTQDNGQRILKGIVDPFKIIAPLINNMSSLKTSGSPKPDTFPQSAESDPAYLIYTSGSTGSPKGIIVEHKNVIAFLRNYRGVFGRAPGEKVLQFPSYSFDVHVMNIWDTFAHGATLCMTSSLALMSDLAGSILRLECTLVDLTPTISTLLFEHAEAQPRGSETIKEAWDRAGFKIKGVNTGGEKVEQWVLDAWAQREVKVVIDYGPTETTVGVVSNTYPVSCNLVPIGRPTGRTRILILSPSQKVVPLGCIGEICVSGAQVTRGYVLRELNDDVFVDHPEYGRIYRTGDLGRFLADGQGNIECLGRKDGQVKINGLRIEIGEIEQYLTPKINKSISRAVVDKIEHESSPPGLVAFLLLSPSFLSSLKVQCGTDLEAVQILSITSCDEFCDLVNDVRIKLAKNLPSYMIPRYWLPVNQLPTQGMGKTDRKTLRLLARNYDFQKERRALRAPAKGQKSVEPNRNQSVDEWHEAVRQAWARTLHVNKEELFDSDEFLRIGGDSIGFMKMVSILRSERFHVSFPEVLDAVTLSDVAHLLRSYQATEVQQNLYEDTHSGYSLVPEDVVPSIITELQKDFAIDPKHIEDFFPTSPSQDSLLAASLDSSHYYAQALYPLHGDITIDCLQKSLAKLVQLHPVLRTCFCIVEHSDETLQVVLRSDSDEVKRCVQVKHVATKTKTAVETTLNWLDEDRRNHAFSWGRLMLSFAVFFDSSGGRKLAWCMHHAMSDGWTLELLTSDLRTLCCGSPVPERPPFSSFVSWWRDGKNASEKSNSFWKSSLLGAQPLGWPSKDHLKGSPLTTNQEELLHWSGDLQSLSRKFGITPAIASRVAIAVALQYHSCSSDVTIGIVRSGRDIALLGADEIIGPCVSVLPSRFQFEKGTTLMALAQQEAKTDRQARTNQHVTLTELVKLCDLKTRSDLFDILVTYQSLAERDDPQKMAAPWPIQQPPELIRMPTSYTLSLEVTPVKNTANELIFACYYDERVISSGTVLDILTSVSRILTAMGTKPETCVDTWQSQKGEIISRSSERLDRLPQNRSRAMEQVDDEEAMTTLTDKLKLIWMSILRFPAQEMSVDDTFTSLGGDSISMMRLSTKLSRAGLPIPACDLINLSTIRIQAIYLLDRL